MSNRIGGEPSASSATLEEFPPYRSYALPAHGVEPRTPLNTIRIPPDIGGEDTQSGPRVNRPGLCAPTRAAALEPVVIAVIVARCRTTVRRVWSRCHKM